MNRREITERTTNRMGLIREFLDRIREDLDSIKVSDGRDGFDDAFVIWGQLRLLERSVSTLSDAAATLSDELLQVRVSAMESAA